MNGHQVYGTVISVHGLRSRLNIYWCGRTIYDWSSFIITGSWVANKSLTLAHGDRTLTTLFEIVNMVQFAKKSLNKENAKTFVYTDHLAKKQVSKKRFCLNKFEEFCKRTDLHGYKYIVMDEYNLLERWAFMHYFICIVIIKSLVSYAYYSVLNLGSPIRRSWTFGRELNI